MSSFKPSTIRFAPSACKASPYARRPSAIGRVCNLPNGIPEAAIITVPSSIKTNVKFAQMDGASTARRPSVIARQNNLPCGTPEARPTQNLPPMSPIEARGRQM